MPLKTFLAMRFRAAQNCQMEFKVSPSTMGLPTWCQYLPLKVSRDVAIQALRSALPDDVLRVDVQQDGTIRLAVLMITWSDRMALACFVQGSLVTDDKHDGYKFWDEVEADRSVAFKWEEVT